MSFLPQAFLSNINSKDGLAKPSRFQIILPIPPYVNRFISQTLIEQLINLPGNIISDVTTLMDLKQDNQKAVSDNTSMTRYLALQCESTELPGRALQTYDVKIYGPTFKVPYLSQYQDINFTFVCTNEFYERKLFDKWMEVINPSDTNNFAFREGEITRYLSNIKIIQYDDFAKQIYVVELMDAFPVSVFPQQLSWGEDGFHRLTVQFAYHRYRNILQSNYNLTEFVLEFFGAKASKWIDQQTGELISPIGSLFNKYF